MARPSKSKHPVARLRRMTGLSQREFAARLGITADHLAQVETGRSVSPWLARQIVDRFGALVPLGEPKDFGDQVPRAVVPGKPLEYGRSLPPLTEEHLQNWSRRVNCISVRLEGRPSATGWANVAKSLDTLQSFLGDSVVGQPAIQILVKGADSSDLLRGLTVAFAKTSGLQLLPPPKDDRGHVPDLTVGVTGDNEPLLHVEFKNAGATTTPQPDHQDFWRGFISVPARPGRPPSAAAGAKGARRGTVRGGRGTRGKKGIP